MVDPEPNANDSQTEVNPQSNPEHSGEPLPPESGPLPPEPSGGELESGEAPSTEGETPKSLEDQLTEAQNRILRLQAELQNTRKRTQREISDTLRYAPLATIRNLLPVIDNVNFGIQAAKKSTTFSEGQVIELLKMVLQDTGKSAEQSEEQAKQLVEAKRADTNSALLSGLQMLDQQLTDVLKQSGCERISALHQPFDPNLHQALSHIPSEEHPAMTVIEEVRPGFKLHDRVVRPTEVIVSSGKPEAAPGENES